MSYSISLHACICIYIYIYIAPYRQYAVPTQVLSGQGACHAGLCQPQAAFVLSAFFGLGRMVKSAMKPKSMIWISQWKRRSISTASRLPITRKGITVMHPAETLSHV